MTKIIDDLKKDIAASRERSAGDIERYKEQIVAAEELIKEYDATLKFLKAKAPKKVVNEA